MASESTDNYKCERVRLALQLGKALELWSSLSALINTSTHYRTSQQMTHKTLSLLHLLPTKKQRKTFQLYFILLFGVVVL
jgi:hypothetical protein